MRIGIVGCGAIGKSLAKGIVKDGGDRAKLTGLLDITREKAEDLSVLLTGNRNLAVSSLKGLIAKSDLIIEAASAKSSYIIAKETLDRGKDVMVMSVGGIVDGFSALSSLARKRHARLFIPSGAISGIDALKAAKMGKITKVILTTSKNPRAFQGVEYVRQKGINLDKITRDKVLFCGPAGKAVKYFPQNINVAAVLSLAGIGKAKTKVKIVASPKAKNNIHEIEIHSKAGKVFTRTENILHPDNPKTSFLAVLSAQAALKQILEPVRIGT